MHIYLIILSCLIVLGNCKFKISDQDYNRVLQYAIDEGNKALDRIYNLEEANSNGNKRAKRSLNIFTHLNNAFSSDALLCSACQYFAQEIVYTIKYIKGSDTILTGLFEAVCRFYFTITTLDMNGYFCDDLVGINTPILIYIFKNNKNVTGDLICSILLQMPECYVELPQLNWTIHIPEKNNKAPTAPKDNKHLTKFLQLTDLHISADYEQGSVANCQYPVCCKKGLGKSVIHKEKAGKWSDPNFCDISKDLFIATLDHIQKNHTETQVVYYTGDVIDHQVWKASKEDHKQLLLYTFDNMKKYFKNFTVLPVIGNHEAIPLNVYPPREITIPKFSQQWLYDVLAESWKDWLPEDALKTVKLEGYYTISLSDQLRVIVLNNNPCYKFNWWLMYDTTFLQEQLNWLVKNLVEAENRGELVHILLHVPTGNQDCILPWERAYNRIITRFEDIITAQFTGHTHYDELKVFYNRNTGKPNNLMFNGASLTPYVKVGPNYKMYTLNPNTTKVVVSDTYTFNLTYANQHPSQPLPWYKMYSLQEWFGLKDISPESINDLAFRMYKNQSLLYKYYRAYIRDDYSGLQEGCDDDCKKLILCKVVTTELFLHQGPLKDYCKTQASQFI